MNDTAFAHARILIVDDQSANVALLGSLLERSGYDNVIATTDSSEVVRLCHEAEPDLVLLDLHMPEPDGFEVLKLLEHLTTRPARLPVLVLTADMAPNARTRALELGARDFVSKPFDLSEVQLKVSNLLEMRRLPRRAVGSR